MPSLSTLTPCLPSAWPGQGAPAVDLGDLVLLHQVVDALGAGVGDLAAALVGRAERHRGVALDPERLLLVGDDVRDLGVAQQRLRRDAADVEADPAPVLLLDDRRRSCRAGLRGSRRRTHRGRRRGPGHRSGSRRSRRQPSGVLPDADSPTTLLACRCTPPTAPTWTRARMLRALPALPAGDDGLADRLAAHLRRRGARLGRRALRRSSRTRSSRSSWRSTTCRGRTSRPSTAGRPPTPGSTARPRSGSSTLTGEMLVWTYVLDAYEGGLPSASYVGVLAERRRGRRRARATTWRRCARGPAGRPGSSDPGRRQVGVSARTDRARVGTPSRGPGGSPSPGSA